MSYKSGVQRIEEEDERLEQENAKLREEKDTLRKEKDTLRLWLERLIWWMEWIGEKHGEGNLVALNTDFFVDLTHAKSLLEVKDE